MTTNTIGSKLFVDYRYIKENHEKNKKTVLDKILDDSTIILRLNLHPKSDMAQIRSWFDSIDPDLKKLTLPPKPEELGMWFEANKQDFVTSENKSLLYILSKRFVNIISANNFEQEEFNHITELILGSKKASELKNKLKVHGEEKKKIVFDELFSVFVKLKGLRQANFLNLKAYAEYVQDLELHEFLFCGKTNITTKLRDFIPYSVCQKLGELIFNPNIGANIFVMIFEYSKDDYGNINPIKNLVFIDGGIQLQKRIIYNEKTKPIKLESGKPISLAVDSCGIIFLLEDHSSEHKIRKISANKSIIIKDKLPLLKKIEVNDTHVFVLDIDGSKVTAFDREDLLETKTLGKVDFDGNTIEDIVCDKIGRLLVVTENYNVHRVNLDFEVVHLYKWGVNDNVVRNADVDKVLAVGKNNDNIYALLPLDKTIVAYNQKMDLLREFKTPDYSDSATILGNSFAISDANNFIILTTKGQKTTIQNCVFGNYSEIKTKYTSIKKIHQNTRGDLFILTNEEKNENNSMAQNFFIECFEQKTEFVTDGEFQVGPLDSGISETAWHKIQVDVERHDVTNTGFFASLRSSKIPTLNDASRSHELLPNPHDSLVDLVGRFAWIKIRLTGNGVQSPLFKNLRILFPRDSYLRYLPKIYQENEHSKKFLEKYLSIFEKFFDDIDEKIFSFHKMLDPQSAKSDFLEWLATWVALSYDKRWPEKNLRNFLNHTPFLYQLRGTSVGLRHTTMFYLDPDYEPTPLSPFDVANDAGQKLTVIENFQLRCGSTSGQSNYAEIFGEDQYSFTLLVDPENITNEKLSVIKTIVENEKPSHTIGEVCLLSQMFVLDGHTYLGRNSRLTEQKLILDNSAIGRSLLS